MKLFSKLPLCCVLLCATASARADTLESYNIAGWNIRALSDNDTGEFSHCAMGATYNSNIILIFSVEADYIWNLSLVKDSWRLNIGDKYRLIATIDHYPPFVLTAKVVDTGQIVAAIDTAGPLFQRFRFGRELTIETASETFSFLLDGTARGLTEVVACIDRHTRSANNLGSDNPFIGNNPNNPFAESAPGVSSPTTPNLGYPKDEHAEAVAFFADLMASADISGYKILQGEDVPSTLRDQILAWYVAGIFGTLDIIKSSADTSPTTLLSQIVARYAQGCRGKFGSRTDAEPDGSENFLPGARMICVNGENTLVTYSVLIRRAAGGYYSVTSTSFSPEDNTANPAAAEFIEKVRAAAFQIQ